MNITSWNSWTVLYFILSIFGVSRFSFETSPPFLPPAPCRPQSPSKLLSTVLCSIFSLHWIRINDVPNKDRWQTSKQFSLSAIVRRSPAKTVWTRAGNLSLPLIFSAGLSHPSYSYHTAVSTNHSIRSYSPTVHLKIPSPYPHDTVSHYEVRILLLFHNLSPPLTPAHFSNHALIFEYYIILCTVHHGLFAVLV